MQVSNCYHVKIFANSMYKRQITSCACADVPDFDFENVSTEI